jgi:hypothetical protein
MKTKHHILSILMLSSILFFSCKKDDPKPVNEEEVLTTLILTFTPSDGSAIKYIMYKDLSPEDTAGSVITSDTLERNKSYTMTVSVLNETFTPAQNITAEIRSEGTDHQFFFIQNPLGLFSMLEYNDKDADDNPIGLINLAKTTDAELSGTMRVVLRHEPLKLGIGVPDGDITNAEGETDIDVTLPIAIK